MEPDHLAPTAPEDAQGDLSAALLARSAVAWELWDRTNDYRDAMAARDDDALVVAWAAMARMQQRWVEADCHVRDVLGRLRLARWYDEQNEEAA